MLRTPGTAVLMLLGSGLVVSVVSACSDPAPPTVFAPSTSPPPRPSSPFEPQGSGAKPDRSTYSRVCSQNADCVLVSFAASACDTCKCPNDAIAVDDQRKFFDEEQAYRETCFETPKPCLADCASLSARCVDKQCTVVTTGAAPTPDAGSDADADGPRPIDAGSPD
jgi:hypothetical protein